jgi:hypothetical protein
MPPVFCAFGPPIRRPTEQKLPETAIPRPEFFAEAGKSDPPPDVSDVTPRIAFSQITPYSSASYIGNSPHVWALAHPLPNGLMKGSARSAAVPAGKSPDGNVNGTVRAWCQTQVRTRRE